MIARNVNAEDAHVEARMGRELTQLTLCRDRMEESTRRDNEIRYMDIQPYPKQVKAVGRRSESGPFRCTTNVILERPLMGTRSLPAHQSTNRRKKTQFKHRIRF